MIKPMKPRMKRLSYLLLCCLTFSGSIFAATDMKDKHEHKNTIKNRNHFELIGAPGIAALSSNNTYLGVTNSETDKLVQTNKDSLNTLAGQFGLGYIYNFHHSKKYYSDAKKHPNKIQWFPSMEPQLNVYTLSSNSIHGDVWRFNSANFNDLSYSIPVHSTRLMLDLAITVGTWKKLSLYAIGGIGKAWNRVSYSDKDNTASSPCPDQRLNLNSHSSTSFAWEAGLGLLYNFNDRFSLSAEYLYASLGKVNFAATGSTGTITSPHIVPAKFNLRSQAGLLGLHVALGKLG